MPNILPMIEADTVAFEPPRDRESLAGVIADTRIAELDYVPLADEEHPSTRRARNACRGPARARRRKYRDPLASESRSALERVRFCP